MQTHGEGVGEADCRGEAEQTCDEKQNLRGNEGLNADENHTGYGYSGAPVVPERSTALTEEDRIRPLEAA